MTRLAYLDYLRGLAAASIMVFHYMSWTIGKFQSESLLGKLGVYGVSIFYVLSGLTLYHVYKEKMTTNWSTIADFGWKRVMRILPLFWLVMCVDLALTDKLIPLSRIVLNATGLFGFVAWNESISTGAWSIGNEWVFYFFFPIFLLSLKKSPTWFAVALAAAFASYCWFAFQYIDSSGTFDGEWNKYTNPLNQVFLFGAGIGIGFYTKNWKPTAIATSVMIAVGAAIFLFYPVQGDRIAIISGLPRLAFTAGAILLAIGFYKNTFAMPQLADKVLRFFGEISYALYMIHPIVYGITNTAFHKLNEQGYHLAQRWQLLASVVGTLLLSWFIYNFFEKYFINLGKNISFVKNPTS